MSPVSKILENLSADERVTIRRAGTPDANGKCVVYWMQRSQRGIDNHALDVAVNAANALRLPLFAYFAPVPFYPGANLRHYAFLQDGIANIAADLQKRNIGFVLRRFPDHSLTGLLKEVQPALLVGDENPLREPERWREVVAKRVQVPFWTVESDVIVPGKHFPKEQYAAYTMRPRITRELPRFLLPFENPAAQHAWSASISSLLLGTEITAGWNIDRSVVPVKGIRPGSEEALRLLADFVQNKLANYSERRNHPECDGTSRLSPYLHFGHIGPLSVALAVQESDAPRPEKDTFLDELIVWRELAVNFVRHNPNYDTVENADGWARNSLAEHAKDLRDVTYSEVQLEAAETHDELWNAAQTQMVRQGWMHNYMRMYWAKKILEWSPSPAHAYNTAVRLNDKYQLDGRDPNGYSGIAWAITGKHDRAWFDRPIFGKVRYMSGKAAARKFNVNAYIESVYAGRKIRQGTPASSRKPFGNAVETPPS